MRMAIPINEDPYTFSGSLGSLNELPSKLVVPRPASLDYLQSQTKFSKKELQHLYRSFKQFCIRGVLTKDEIKKFYAQIFNKAHSDVYAEFVFQAFDLNKDEFVCFEDLAETYSILTRGTAEEKLNWIFNFYDINNKGKVGRLEMLGLVKILYLLSGRENELEVRPENVFNHVIEVYESMSSPENHHLTKNQFVSYGLNDKRVLEDLQSFYP